MEIIPIEQGKDSLIALRDPEGLTNTVVMSYGAVMLAVWMDGRHNLAEIQAKFKQQTGRQVALADLEQLVKQLDKSYLLANERFEEFRRKAVEEYLKNPVRPALHAGGAYAGQPDKLRKQLAGFFTCKEGPGEINADAGCDGRQLRGLVSPHIDLHRGGPAFAWTYKKIAEQSKAELFVIFGTAHTPMKQLFCASRKDFDTPLGVVRTDGRFIDRLAGHLASSVAGQNIDLFEDEMVHRHEHSIEFQAMFLQYVLGGNREFRIVPVLIGSFEEFLQEDIHPDESPEVQAFIAAVCVAAAEHAKEVCYISAADFAHVGKRFGDDWLMDERRLAEQGECDRQLLEAVCRGDGAEVFRHVARRKDRDRICGLSPTYIMLEVVGPVRGEVLKYDQAVEPDGSSCVSFASMALYGETAR